MQAMSAYTAANECVEKNIPETEAIDRLIAIIKESGDWKDA